MLIVFDPRSVYVNEAAQITLGNAQNRVQNELKYPCSGEEYQQRYTYVYWDSSNSSGQSSKNQLQNEIKQTCIGHQDICCM